MNLQILNERENRLLHRTEIEARVTFDSATPSREEIIKLIAAKKNVPENLVIVENIDQKFGQRVADVFIKIYESESTLKELEPEYMIKRHVKEESKEGEQ